MQHCKMDIIKAQSTGVSQCQGGLKLSGVLSPHRLVRLYTWLDQWLESATSLHPQGGQTVKQ